MNMQLTANNSSGSPKMLEFPGDRKDSIYSPTDRVAIFIDGSNLFYAALQLQIELDYCQLIATLTAGRRLVRPYFYTGVDPNNEKQRGFLLWMRRNGYRVIAKPMQQTSDGARKVALDVEMTVDMMKLAPYCDTIILMSGDGKLSYAVNEIAHQGNKFEIVSLRSMTSDELINAADYFVDLAEIAPKLDRHTETNKTRLAS